MSKKITSLINLEEEGIIIPHAKDRERVERHLRKRIDVYLREDGRIESETGKYLAATIRTKKRENAESEGFSYQADLDEEGDREETRDGKVISDYDIP